MNCKPLYSSIKAFILSIFLGVSHLICCQTSTLPVKGWAQTSVNGVVFRKNSVVTFQNTQYTAFYDSLGYVILGKRTLGSSTWQTQLTPYKGNINDAHNSISIAIDGSGYLHLSWDHHNNALNYCKSTAPASLNLGAKQNMIGSNEADVTYPEFHYLPSGDLLFMYREGVSGNGNLVINKYSIQQKTWKRLHSNLLDGQGIRNAYWQAAVDVLGNVHLSWVWRETADVASNHDICYAKSSDGGLSWKKTNGSSYTLPITMANSEIAATIPQNSNLMNQTSMYGDVNGHPYICNYWNTSGSSITQYRLVYHNGSQWLTQQISNRTTTFSLSGTGTKKIPISRPQIMVDNSTSSTRVIMIYRDQELGSKVSLAYTTNLNSNQWKTLNLTPYTVNSWEPSFDIELWKASYKLHIFVQNMGQGDGETAEPLPAQEVNILEWKPSDLSKIDCNGDAGGTAIIDSCGTCVGGNTPLMDCKNSPKEGYYVIKAMHSNLCLQPGTTVSQENCNSQTNQVWQLIRKNGQYALLSVPAGQYLAASQVPASSTVTMSGTPSYFILEDAGQNTFKIVSPINTQYVMDINGASTAPGTRMLMYKRTSGNNQRFYFFPADCKGIIGGTAHLDPCGICLTAQQTSSCVTTLTDKTHELETFCTPNPFNHSFKIHATGSFEYELIKPNGTIVSSGFGKDTQTIVVDAPNGSIYILKIKTNNKTFHLKLLKD